MTPVAVAAAAAALWAVTTPDVRPAQSSPPAAAGAQVLLRLQDDRIAESSGLAVGSQDGVLFTHQDAGRPPEVYAIGPDGSTRLVLRLPQGPGTGEDSDWEDIARGTDESGKPVLLLGDIGDAFAVRRAPRRTVTLLRVPEPHVPLTAPPGVVELSADSVEAWELAWPDDRARNAEALAVHPATGEVVVVDKSRSASRPTHVWRAPAPFGQPEPGVFERLARIPVTGASGAAFSPTGDRFVVREATSAHVWDTSGGTSLQRALAEEPVVVPLPEQRQGESVAFTADGAELLVGSEGPRSAIYRVPLPADARAASTPAPAPMRQTATGAEDVERSSRREVIVVSAVAGSLGFVAALALAVAHVVGRRRDAA